LALRDFEVETIELLWRDTDFINGCWIYRAGWTTDSGYKKISLGHRKLEEFVHRISANVFLGLSLYDKTLQVNHKIECPRKDCWNPSHLYIGTNADNMRDRYLLGGYKKKKFCINGHFFSEENTRLVPRTRNGKIYKEKTCKICNSDSSNRYRKKKRGTLHE